MLSLRHRKVLAGRRKGLTYSELGKLLDVGKERIRQMELTSIRKLRFALSKKYKINIIPLSDLAVHLWMGRNWRKQKFANQCPSKPKFSKCIELAKWMLVAEDVEEACIQIKRLGVGADFYSTVYDLSPFPHSANGNIYAGH